MKLPQLSLRDPLSLVALVMWCAFCGLLVFCFDPPPQPRYDGRLNPLSVAGTAFAFFGPYGLLAITIVGLMSLSLALLVRNRWRGLLVWLNIAAWLGAYASIPLWNAFLRLPE